MNMSDDTNELNVDELLTVDGNDIDTKFQQQLFHQTTGMIRSRRRRKRIVMSGSLVACYVAGMATVSLFSRAVVDADDRVPPLVVEQKMVEPQNVVDPHESQTRAGQQPVRRVPRPIKRVKKSRFQALRDMGDLYLNERQDPAGAIRCYRLALREATPEETIFSATEGTWLFRALLQDSQTHPQGEKNDALHNG